MSEYTTTFNAVAPNHLPMIATPIAKGYKKTFQRINEKYIY